MKTRYISVTAALGSQKQINPCCSLTCQQSWQWAQRSEEWQSQKQARLMKPSDIDLLVPHTCTRIHTYKLIQRQCNMNIKPMYYIIDRWTFKFLNLIVEHSHSKFFFDIVLDKAYKGVSTILVYRGHPIMGLGLFHQRISDLLTLLSYSMENLMPTRKVYIHSQNRIHSQSSHSGWHLQF